MGKNPAQRSPLLHDLLMLAAQRGDTVNIDSRGLIVNGAYQQEQGIIDETTQVADGVTFPLTVPEGSVFLLGDNREEVVDSRIVG